MKRSRLNPVSNKRKAANIEYEQSKREWRATHDGRCEMIFGLDDRLKDYPIERNYFAPENLNRTDTIMGAHRCRRKAAKNPHHMARRGRLLSDKQYFLGVCFECHEWIENNGREAEKLGYLIRIYAKH